MTLTAKATMGSEIVSIDIPHLFHIAPIFFSITSFASLYMLFGQSRVGYPITLCTILLEILIGPPSNKI